MHFKRIVCLSTLLCIPFSASRADVTFWEVSKAVLYDQSADNTAPSSSTNWIAYASVETDAASDATSVVLEGGNITGSLAFDGSDGYWELVKFYPSKAALDAELPAGETYSIILSEGTLGTVVQQFDIVADAYPDTPYLTGTDYSSLQALDSQEPFEINWNTIGTSGSSVAFQLNEDSIFEGNDVIYTNWNFANTSFTLASDMLSVGTDYEGLLEFINATNHTGTGGFEVFGTLSYIALVRFPVMPMNTAVGFDDFNDAGVTESQWSVLFPPEEAVDTFTLMDHHLEYTSQGTGDTFIAWGWAAGELSYTQDWSVAIDVTDTIPANAFMDDEETYFGLIVLGDGDLQNNYSAEFLNSQAGREVATYAEEGGNEVIDGVYISVAQETVTLKLSFDADTKIIYSAFSVGDDYVVQTNMSTAGWGMTDASVFNPAIYSGSYYFEVNPGEIFADNFRIYGEPAISNHIQRVELEYFRDFAFPGASYDQRNEGKVWLSTDDRVTSASFTIPAGEVVAFTNVYSEGSSLSWDFEDITDIDEPFDTNLDGDWLFTVGLDDGTFHSTVIPYTKEDGVSPIPVMTDQPLFTAVNVAEDKTSVVLEWGGVDANANAFEISKEINNEDSETVGFYSDGLTDELGLAPAITGPLSTRTSPAIPLDPGVNSFYIGNIWARTAYNDDGVPYVVLKISESGYSLDTDDLDRDGMPDAWEIDFFGSTNAVNGAALDDFDLDGMINLNEFIGGSNPTNSASVFMIETAHPDPSGFILNWNALEGRFYGVYWAESLTSEFLPLETYMEYPRNSYTDTVHTVESSGFYLIDVMLAE